MSGIKMKFILGLPLILKLVAGMRIPADTEMVGGYIALMEADDAPTDDYFEARSMSDQPIGHPIRDRRSAMEWLQAPQPEAIPVVPFDSTNGELAMNSDADPNDAEYANNIAYSRAQPPKKQTAYATDDHGNRHKREVEVNATVTEKFNDNNRTHNESLPSPSKQVMRNSGDMVGYWTQAPNDFARMNYDDDVSADASTLNEGINARAPRVNFITQQKRTFDDDDSTVSATRSEFYRNGGVAVNDRVGDRMLSGPPPPFRERERERERYVNRDPDSDDFPPRRFDRYESSSRYSEEPPLPRSYYPSPYEREMHPEYHRVHDSFDPYMPRIPSYPDPYYEYPDRRYDVPEQRDYPPLYNNDLDDRYRVMDPDRYNNVPTGRIIYYEHLPEVGRGPPYENRFRNRDYDPYYTPYEHPYLGAYRRPMPPVNDYDYRRDPSMPSSGILKVEDPNDRRPVQDDRVYYDRDGSGSGNGSNTPSNSTTSPTDQESRGYRPADHRSYY